MRSLNKSIANNLIRLKTELKRNRMFPVLNLRKFAEIIGVSQQAVITWKKMGMVDCNEISERTHVYDLRKNINKLLTYCKELEAKGTMTYQEITIKEIYEDGSEVQTTYTDKPE